MPRQTWPIGTRVRDTRGRRRLGTVVCHSQGFLGVQWDYSTRQFADADLIPPVRTWTRVMRRFVVKLDY